MKHLTFIIIICIIFFGLLTGFLGKEHFQKETLKELEEIGELEKEKKLAEEIKEKLPGETEEIFKKEVLPFWEKMYNFIKNWWQSYIQPKFERFFKKEVEPRVKEEVKKRKTILEEELEKEKEEIKGKIEKEIEKKKRNIWQRFKDLIFKRGE